MQFCLSIHTYIHLIVEARTCKFINRLKLYRAYLQIFPIYLKLHITFKVGWPDLKLSGWVYHLTEFYTYYETVFYTYYAYMYIIIYIC